jgi:hypothetical protein
MIQSLARLGWSKALIEAHVKRLNLGPINKVLDYTFKLREQPMWVRGSSLPLVTPEALRSLIGPEVIRLSRFEYNIDVTGLGAPSPFGDQIAMEA